MSEKYIPTTDEVRDHYDPSCEPRFQDDDRLEKHIPAEFDRWLAAHDARIRDESEKEVLELIDERDGWEKRITDLIYKFADVSEVGEWSSGNDLIDSFRDWLRGHLITSRHDARVRRKALELSDEEFQWLIDNVWGGQEIWNEDGVGNLIKGAFFSLSKRREASDVRA